MGKGNTKQTGLHNSSDEPNFLNSLKKSYTRAAELYKKCISYTHSEQYRALAFEGLGRCLLSSEKYDEAEKVYT